MGKYRRSWNAGDKRGRWCKALAEGHADTGTQDISDTAIGDYFGDWLRGMPWEHFATFTYAKPCRRPDTALRHIRQVFNRFSTTGNERIFTAVEFHKGKDDVHMHSIIHKPDLWRKGLWEAWFARFGRAQVVPIDKIGGVTGYVAKYVTKDCRDESLWDIW